MDLANHILPRRQMFQGSDRNNGTKRNDKIMAGTATFCARTLSAGMLTGLTSPSRPWFRLSTPDPQMMDVPEVRSWLHLVEELLRFVFSKSNLYDALPQAYLDLGVFGTSVVYVEEDVDRVIRCQTLPVGSYYLAANDRLQVDTVYRRFGMTVRQLVEKFGIDSVSARVRSQYREGRLDTWVDVIQAVQPRAAVRPAGADWVENTSMPWQSLYVEENGDDTNGPLRESGYLEFPFLASRWLVTGEDVYGSSPGMDALGDIKALQFLTKQRAQAVDKLVNPPLAASSALKGTPVSLLPGAINWVSPTQMGRPIEPLFLTTMNLGDLQQLILEAKQEIRTTFYTDLLLMMGLTQEPRQMTAREVEERHEEKMLQLGSVLQRLNTELLDPLIGRTFAICWRRGIVPPPPEAVAGVNLRVEFISILAQAQQLVHLLPIRQLIEITAMVAQLKPEVVDKLEAPEIVDEAARLLGVNPKLLVEDEKLERLASARAQQQQAQQLAMAAETGSQAVRNLAQAPMGEENALDRLIASYQGGGAPA